VLFETAGEIGRHARIERIVSTAQKVTVVHSLTSSYIGVLEAQDTRIITDFPSLAGSLPQVTMREPAKGENRSSE
jgi:hypothetical protein